MRLLTAILATTLLAAVSAVHCQQQKISPSELKALDAMRTKIMAHWNLPAAIFLQPDKVKIQAVVVRFHLGPDGRLSAPIEVINPTSDSLSQASVEAAKRAILLSQPFDMLSPSNYDAWKDVQIRFDPSVQQPQSK